jgi:hypothetical protein
MQSKATQAYAQAIESASYSVASAMRKLNVLKVNRKVMGKVMRALDKIISDDYQMHLMTDGEKPKVYIMMRHLESFKDEKLMKVLSYLSETMDNMHTEDWPASVNRDYRFTSSTHSAVISAYVRDDSPTCRKVLVGTELQTVEKFEIVCD